MSAVCLSVATPVVAEGSAVENDKAGFTYARFGFINAVAGSNRLDVRLDGRRVWRGIQVYRPTALQKFIKGEGYVVDFTTTWSNLAVGDTFTTNIVAGRSYTLVAAGNLDISNDVQPILVDHDRQAVARGRSHVALVNATTDAPELTLQVNGEAVHAGVELGGFTDYVSRLAGWGRVEIFAGPTRVYGPKFHWFRSGATMLFTIMGTVESRDGHPVRVVVTRPK